jgi:hypothetical protein
MGEIVKVVIPFLSTPKNYGEILSKLAVLTIYETYIITRWLRANPRFDDLLRDFGSWGLISNIVAIVPHKDVVDPASLVVAFVVAGLSYVFQLHDRISDVLGIRRRFDRRRIF